MLFDSAIFDSGIFDVGAPGPSIAVTGNGVSIADEDLTPSLSDWTDFDEIYQYGATLSRTYVVSNPGGATLNISSVTVPAGYTITTNLPATISAGGNANLVVRLDNAVLGVKSGDVTINSDATPAAFNFAITGTVAVPPFNVLVPRGSRGGIEPRLSGGFEE